MATKFLSTILNEYVNLACAGAETWGSLKEHRDVILIEY